MSASRATQPPPQLDREKALYLMAHAAWYPPADRSQNRIQFAGHNADGSLFKMPRVTKLLLHSTETQGWPGYPTFAPQFTYDPWKHLWRQHMPLPCSASTLADPSWTAVRENRDDIVQIEIVGYCDPARWPTYGHNVEKMDAQALKDLGEFAAWLHTEWELPLQTNVVWVTYPHSYGLNATQRLNNDRFDAYQGLLGHQHASGNSHGDPGHIDINAILAAAEDAVTPTPEPEPELKTPVLIGHRGIGLPWTGVLGIPENSIPAIQWAAAHHADIIEGDVQNSADGIMFMMHDDTLNRTTNGTGTTTMRTWIYIKERWLEVPRDTDGNGDDDNTLYHPPSFRKWLAAAKGTGKRVFVELKNGPLWDAAEVREFVGEVKLQGMADKVIVAGSEADLTTAKSVGAKHLSWAIDPADNHTVAKIRSVVGDHGYVTFRLTAAETHQAYTKMLVDAGVRVLLWTLTRDEHYARALPFGVYGWFCNNVEDAWTWLQEHSA